MYTHKHVALGLFGDWETKSPSRGGEGDLETWCFSTFSLMYSNTSFTSWKSIKSAETPQGTADPRS